MDYYSSLDSRLLDVDSPTLFEIISATQLEKLLSPSIRFIIVQYIQRFPNRYLIRLINRFDEFNLIARGAIEYNFLKNWNSTFIEKFYGLKRVLGDNHYSGNLSEIPIDIKESRRRLKSLQIFISLIEIVGLDYLKEKLDLLHDKIYSKKLLNKELTSFENLFLTIYPVFKTSLLVLDLLFKVLYLSGNVKSPTLLTYLFKINYARLNTFDYQLNEKRVENYLNTNTPARKTIFRPPTLSQQVYLAILRTLKPAKVLVLLLSNKIFPASIFLLKFLEWWNSSDFASKFSTKDSIDKKFPPPKFKNLNSYKNCPLCNKKITNPTVIETGFVFCYSCIHNYLNGLDDNEAEYGRCPVTGQTLLGCKYLDGQWKIECIRRLM
ncbi:hypothetical protein PACTADRAFT_48126, partial [Pachysolen tannophilus NRRL Y-2460]